MKIGIRVPSLKKRLAARTSWKRVVRHSMGLKAPRGMGIITNPKKAIYNKIYNKTSIGVDKILAGTVGTANSINSQSSSQVNKPHNKSIFVYLLYLVLIIIFWPFAILYLIYKIAKHKNKAINTNGNN